MIITVEVNIVSLFVFFAAIIVLFLGGYFIGKHSGIESGKKQFVKDYKAGEFIVDLKNPQMNVTGEVPNTYMKTTEHLENVVQKPYALYTVRWLTKD